jgi:hypothetical protein
MRSEKAPSAVGAFARRSKKAKNPNSTDNHWYIVFLAKLHVLPLLACRFRYPTRALFGAVAPERHIVVYGADRQSWNSVCGALHKGLARDGDVTLVLERVRAHQHADAA